MGHPGRDEGQQDPEEVHPGQAAVQLCREVAQQAPEEDRGEDRIVRALPVAPLFRGLRKQTMREE